MTKMVRRMVEVVVCHFTRSDIFPANRQALTHRVESAEHGKPNCLHLENGKQSVRSAIDKWVEEVGKSKCHSVMEWIRVQNLPGTKVSRLPAGVESREIYATF
ncbi:MAG: hypothetical protein KJ826_12340 [Proteobacteria bacterium]|nr:hypothetical protein [Pseudomonadota bacterium]MBU4034968.1 hypothetical protein [Pseudomonadota bacterium]